MAFQTHQQELDFLNSLGFTTNPLNSEAQNIQEVWQASEILAKDKDNLPYPIDGLVVKLNDNILLDNLGVVGKTPRGWCAIKFKAEEVTTKLLGVSWQVGRTGKVTPVADLEPVELAGTTVKRATLHNYKEFLESELHLNDTLVIRKAGEIIPEVLQILTNLRDSSAILFLAPTVCPSCNSELFETETGVDLVCKNIHCRDQVVARLSYFCQRNLGNITGLSEKQIEKFIELFGVEDVADLYNLPFEQIKVLEGFGEKSVENLINSVEKARNIESHKFLAGLGIDGIGPEVAKLICEKIEAGDTANTLLL